MRTPWTFTCILAGLACLLLPSTAAGIDYPALQSRIDKERQSLERQWASAPGQSQSERLGHLEQHLLQRIDSLHRAWLGTRWGLGMPQTTRSQQGKVNCGLFVALILRYAGFNFNIWTFNRQAAVHAIKSMAPRKQRRYFSRVKMKRFLAEVKKMGPGLFLIGLDFHIGFLRQDERGLRFIHASYIDKVVVDEPAKEAIPIVTSKNRVVGKILQPRMLRGWLSNKRIKILGKR